MKNPVKFLGLFLLILVITSCKKFDKRPNIVFIMTDDHTQEAISAYGSYRNTTPNIDRLAKEGMLFNHSYVTNSICAPSRAVILSGKHSHINGKIDNSGQEFNGSQVTFPKLLQAAGYQTAMIGKWHLRSEPTGFDFWKVLPGQGNYYNPSFNTPEGMEQIEGYVTDIITDVALDWLKGRDKENPFLLMYQHKAPHREWEPAIRHMEEYLNKTFPEPESLFDNYVGRGTAAKEAEMSILDHMRLGGDTKIHPDIFGEHTEIPQSQRGFASLTRLLSRYTPSQLKAWQEHYGPMNEEFKETYPDMSEEDMMRFKYQRYMQDYMACVAAVDENIGRVIDFLEENNLEDNTIIVYTSDQGFYLGEHGWFDKRFMYKESLSTPLIIKWPGKIKPGTKNNDLVQNLDFAGTFLEAAGIEAPLDMQGESMVRLFSGKNHKWRDAIYYHYYEYPAVHQVKRHYGIMTKKYKLIHFYDDVDEWELFDLESDPGEMNNVYNVPAYNDIKEDLITRLKELREYYKDDTGAAL